ncbi:hypothetical protein BSIN_4393 [Burkholderia singularis]|uniref:Uncharacterized protein n=1 Tax=Burkholderia singularis TaxID=1503053 RepID=A0A238H8X2_9BURK|nr:hypothetical protein BSIN_4393 [Burkholderia singularis]
MVIVYPIKRIPTKRAAPTVRLIAIARAAMGAARAIAAHGNASRAHGC